MKNITVSENRIFDGLGYKSRPLRKEEQEVVDEIYELRGQNGVCFQVTVTQTERKRECVNLLQVGTLILTMEKQEDETWKLTWFTDFPPESLPALLTILKETGTRN